MPGSYACASRIVVYVGKSPTNGGMRIITIRVEALGRSKRRTSTLFSFSSASMTHSPVALKSKSSYRRRHQAVKVGIQYTAKDRLGVTWHMYAQVEFQVKI